MEKSLHDLIEAASISGQISDEQRRFIVGRAKEQGVDEAEVNIYIEAAISRNSKSAGSAHVHTTPSSAPTATQHVGDWLQRKDFTIADWVIVVGCVLTLIAGFFPWVQSSVSSSGFGPSYSSGASVGGGFVYSIPLGIVAFVTALKHKYNKYRLYYGLIIMAAAIGFIVSYDNRSSANYGGISASASTGAGPGVAILLLGGLVYTIGAFLARFGSNEQIKENGIKILKIAGVLFLVNVCYSGLTSWSARNSGSTNFDDLYYPIISLAAIIALPRFKQTSFIRVPLIFLYTVILVDIFLRTMSIFPTNEVSAIVQDKLGEDAYNVEIPSEVYELSISNDNWFSTYYSGDGFLSKISEIAGDIIQSFAWILTIPGYLIVLFFALTIYPKPALEDRIKSAGNKIEDFLGDRWKSKGSVSNWVSHWGTYLLTLLVVVKLSTAFAFNTIRHTQILSKLSDVTDTYEEAMEAKKDSIEAANQKAEALKAQVGQLNSMLSGFYASPTEILDSTYVVVVESYKDYAESEQRINELKALGLPADKKDGPYNSSLSYSPKFITIGVYSNFQNCQNAASVLKGLFPQAVGYYLPSYGDMLTLEKLELQKASQDSMMQVTQ